MSYKVEYNDLGIKDYKNVWDYQTSVFDGLVEAKRAGNHTNLPGMLIFTEHPHVYTLGRNGSESNLLLSNEELSRRNATYYKIDRGGDITYHGPGQIVGYPIFDLERINIPLKEYIYLLEEAIIRTVAESGLKASRLPGGTGVWLDPDVPSKARKICAIGVRASRFITMHGFAFNINTDLSYFSSINPCGFIDKGVTSLEKELGARQDFEFSKIRVRKHLKEIFDLEWINI